MRGIPCKESLHNQSYGNCTKGEGTGGEGREVVWWHQNGQWPKIDNSSGNDLQKSHFQLRKNVKIMKCFRGACPRTLI